MLSAENIALSGLAWLQTNFDEFCATKPHKVWLDQDRQHLAIAECAIVGLIAYKLGSPTLTAAGHALLDKILLCAYPRLLERTRHETDKTIRVLLVVAGVLSLTEQAQSDALCLLQQAFNTGDLAPASLRFDHLQELQFWLSACGLFTHPNEKDGADWQLQELLLHAEGVLNSSDAITAPAIYSLTHGVFYLTHFNLSAIPPLPPLALSCLLAALDLCSTVATTAKNIDLLGELLYARWCLGVKPASRTFLQLCNSAQLAEGAMPTFPHLGLATPKYTVEQVYHSTITTILASIAINRA
jgi:hypothetical protein